MVAVNFGSTDLFKPLKVGNIELKHRVSLAPLTRNRTTGGEYSNTILDLSREYYDQRSKREGTLIITEAVSVSTDHTENLPPFMSIPVYLKENRNSWKTIFDSIHANKSFVFLQLWWGILSKNPVEDVTSLSKDKLKEIVGYFVDAAETALKDGADGLEVHFANGYTSSGFLNPFINQRTDEYGGSIENRARFALEIIDTLGQKFGYEKIGLRISPFHRHDKEDIHTDTVATYAHLVGELESRRLKGKELAYIHAVEPRPTWIDDRAVDEALLHENIEFIPAIWNGVFIRAGNLVQDHEIAKTFVSSNPRTILAFGRYFISNPDLPDRLEKGLELTPYNRPTFYTQGPEGYIDYEAFK
ncbi:hypothetical protein WICMUC_003241 [Wickerhamomyces mucosus]|uniref:NADH:flavin oxidoreductase/NADH oxidase N-terminal domain-containing protein n=1 Tax=Wickerhamomyces mucosus TaxID=1378264 RepID=A0A9P8TD66_9ASCO|nr:hypothetical protein WICMUC_003241 [Wickerhamomyces mucosus]